MPFTISHTAAVIPFFRWKRLDPLALVIGSMAPDFGYFVHQFSFAGHSHSLVGSLTLALPVASVAWLLCRCFAGFLTGPLPDRLGTMMREFFTRAKWQVSAPFWIVLSLLLGIWTHTILDSFTHDTGWVVRRVAFLNESWPWPFYRLLQHLASLLGMLVLAMIYWRWQSERPGRVRMDTKGILLVVVVIAAVLLAIPSALSYASDFVGYRQMRVFIVRWIVNSMALSAGGYFVLAVVLAWRTRGRAGITS
ncbi:DUF4184 family protein [Luteolibacter sp. Populi]|uniref:DUF4184 family protein n=1 Tax=Luteolibacter sp. Populi TaxID=3230487 RepID=UPI003465E332